MGNHSDIEKEVLLAKVRKIMVMRGATVSGRDIAEILEKNNIKVSHNYASRMRDKILGERKARVDRKLASLHVSDIEDTNEALITHCWDIIMNKNEATHNKLSAMSLLADLKIKTFGQLMDAGIFTRKIGEVNHTMGPEMQKELEEVKACLRMQFGERIRPIIYQEPEEAKIIEPIQINEPEQKQIEQPKAVHPNQAILDAKRGEFIG